MSERCEACGKDVVASSLPACEECKMLWRKGTSQTWQDYVAMKRRPVETPKSERRSFQPCPCHPSFPQWIEHLDGRVECLYCRKALGGTVETPKVWIKMSDEQAKRQGFVSLEARADATIETPDLSDEVTLHMEAFLKHKESCASIVSEALESVKRKTREFPRCPHGERKLNFVRIRLKDIAPDYAVFVCAEHSCTPLALACRVNRGSLEYGSVVAADGGAPCP